MSTFATPAYSYAVPHEILIGFDSSDSAHKAADCAKSLARRFGSHVTLAHVSKPENPIFMPEGGYFQEADDRAAARTDAELDQAVEEFRADGLQADKAEHWGGVSAELQSLAREKSADLLVLGTRAPHGLDRILFGSVGEELADRSGWPVMIIGPNVQTPVGPWSPTCIGCIVEKTPENASAVVYAYHLASELGADFKLFAITDSRSELEEFTGNDRFYNAIAAELPGVDVRREAPIQKIWHSVADDFVRLRLKMHDLGAVVLAANSIGPLHTHLHRDLLSGAVEAAECPVIVVGREERRMRA